MVSPESNDEGPKTINDKEDTLFTVGEVPALVDCEEVQAVCTNVHRHYFNLWQSERIVFDFEVIDPEVHAKTKLQMFCRWDRKWKSPPKNSRIFRTAWIALGGLRPRQRIHKGLFVGKVFRCRLRLASPKDGPAYSVVDMILVKLTG